MEYYSAIKKSELLGMNLKGIMLNEKKNNLKRSYTVWFHLGNSFEITKLCKWKTDLPEDKVGDEGVIMKGHH